jgi:hypothetical protein
MSRPPRDFGIQVDKVVTLRNNTVLLESRYPSVLKLGESKLLKELKLTARPANKTWPKILIFDVQESVTKEQRPTTATGIDKPRPTRVCSRELYRKDV